MVRSLVLSAAVLAAVAPAGAMAQSEPQPSAQAETGQPPQRIRQVTLTGEEKCPTAASDEIVVCSRLDPNEQFRVPKALRQAPEVPAQNQSWINRAATVDRVGRVAGGLPNTCSPVGTGGQSGCGIVAGQAWAAERRQAQREAEAAIPESRTDIELDDEPQR
ncbi:hypothetical protein [Sphingomonas dokdonensis]|uniref:Secreted protein n=1 Tax=Sphingomonas dokdonensis TaxID=344880 RepID=A0A245ZPI3_9SPHN|nr:hypothetical protein [Sphingomonas dokdonensis]OWK31653.1 hypothetical protein SPDO_16630 [Sphingomonas dokdonensis]